MNLERVDVHDVRIARLLQLYLHEWSALLPERARIGADGLFAYPEFHDVDDAVLFTQSERLVGFAFVNVDEKQHCAHVEEFFVLAGERGRGLGTAAAHALFTTRPGPWTFTVRPENPGALAFWRRAVSTAADAGVVVGDVVEAVELGDDGVVRTRLSFTVPHRP